MDLRGMGSRRQGAMASSVRSTDSGLMAQPRADRGEGCLVKCSASPTGRSPLCRRPAAVWAGSLGRCATEPHSGASCDQSPSLCSSCSHRSLTNTRSCRGIPGTRRRPPNPRGQGREQRAFPSVGLRRRLPQPAEWLPDLLGDDIEKLPDSPAQGRDDAGWLGGVAAANTAHGT